MTHEPVPDYPSKFHPDLLAGNPEWRTTICATHKWEESPLCLGSRREEPPLLGKYWAPVSVCSECGILRVYPGWAGQRYHNDKAKYDYDWQGDPGYAQGRDQ